MPFFSTMAGTRCLGSVKATVTRKVGGFLAKYTDYGTLIWNINNSGVTPLGLTVDSSGDITVFYVNNSGTTTVNIYNNDGSRGYYIPSLPNGTYVVVKYNTGGTVVWGTYITGTGAGTGATSGGEITCDSSGNIFIAANYTTSGTITSSTGGTTKTMPAPFGMSDLFLAKYDSSGIIQWVAQIGGTDLDGSPRIATDSSGSVYLTSPFIGAAITLNSAPPSVATLTLPSGSNDIFIAKYDSSGSVVWGTRITSSSVADRVAAIRIDSSNNLYLAGLVASNGVFYSSSFGGGVSKNISGVGNRGYLVKYNSNGNVVWVSSWGGVSSGARAMTLDNSGNIFIIGTQNASIPQFTNASGTVILPGTNIANFFLVKYDSSGTPVWVSRIEGLYLNVGRMYTDSDGNIFAYLTLSNTLRASFYDASSATLIKKALSPLGALSQALTKYDSSGNILWVAQINSGGYEAGGVGVNSNLNAFICGYNATNVGTIFYDAV